MNKRATKRAKLANSHSSTPTNLKSSTSGKPSKKTKHRRQEVQPLGAFDVTQLLADDASKDDEERRLEASLFGVPYVPASSSSKTRLPQDDDDDDSADEEYSGGRELENMLDTDLFFVDDGPSTSTSFPKFAAEALEDEDLNEPPTSHRSSGSGSSSASSSHSSSESESGDDKAPNHPPPPSKHRASAWTDPDDTSLQVSLASDNRLRKLRDTVDEDAVGGREYERRLRRQFERLNPTPAWAQKAKSKAQKSKRKRLSPGSDVTDEDEETGDQPPDDDVDDILTSTGGLRARSKNGVIAKGTLNIERLRDANQSARSEGAVKSIRFHPSPAVPLLAVASSDRRVRLFNIDGHTNPHLQTLHLPELPLTTLNFHPSGRTLLLTGPRPFWHTYDLATGAALRSPRGLWGNASGSSGSRQEGSGAGQDLSLETLAYSPDGSVLAIAGRNGYIHLVDWTAGAGGGMVVGSLKMNRSVKALWWARGGNSETEGREVMGLGEDGEVYVWDVGERKCVRRWKDEGAFGARVMEGDQSGRYLATGSSTGFVSLYGQSEAQPSKNQGIPNTKPNPLKAIGNLTTSITSLRFNHDAQLLAIGSDAKKDQLRLIHLPSMTAFANWPNAGTPLGTVNCVDFSAKSEYVAAGNGRGRVGLWSLRDYGL